MDLSESESRRAGVGVCEGVGKVGAGDRVVGAWIPMELYRNLPFSIRNLSKFKTARKRGVGLVWVLENHVP